VQEIVNKEDAFEILRTGASGDDTFRLDEVAEKEILNFCKDLPLPSTLISEEIGTVEITPETQKSTNIGSNHLWVVADPIDGSKNAQRGIPFFNTSIAIATGPSIKNLQAGIVLNLCSGNEYVVERDRGSWYNRKKASPSPTIHLKTSILGTEFVPNDFDPNSISRKVLTNVYKIRAMGAVAEALCLIGTGGLDVFIYLHKPLRFLDIAAAKLFIEEAGGIITDVKGEPIVGEISLDRRMKVLASATPELLRALLEILL
jgi:myo-inositol-1(or 4)-monophosphatase